jgi:hypothetical protein
MRTTTLLICLLIAQFGLCQSDNLLKNYQLRLNFINPGFTFEKSISNSSSLIFQSEIIYGFNVRGSETTHLFAPLIETQYRYYYNLNSRKEKQKNISDNSGSYIAASAMYGFKPINNDNFISMYDGLTVGALWGFQKTYKSKLNIGTEIGLGYNISENQPKKIVHLIGIKFGYVLF